MVSTTECLIDKFVEQIFIEILTKLNLVFINLIVKLKFIHSEPATVLNSHLYFTPLFKLLCKNYEIIEKI